MFLQFVLKTGNTVSVFNIWAERNEKQRSLVLKGEKPYVGSALRNTERTGTSGIITVDLIKIKIKLHGSHNTPPRYGQYALKVLLKMSGNTPVSN